MNEIWKAVNGYVLRMIWRSFVIHVTNLIRVKIIIFCKENVPLQNVALAEEL
jgi:hypothetical protein